MWYYICSTWFLDIRILTCLSILCVVNAHIPSAPVEYQPPPKQLQSSPTESKISLPECSSAPMEPETLPVEPQVLPGVDDDNVAKNGN